MDIADYTALLPAELLHAIFSLLPGRHTPALLRKVPSWVSVSHVCRRWREVALKCRPLWIRTPFPNSDWAEEALLRSSPALLDVFVDAAFHSETIICIALRDLSRIRTLHLSVAAMSLSGHFPAILANTKTVNHILPACMRGLVPNLEELDIVAANDYVGLTRDLLVLSAKIFGGTVPPCLRRFAIEGCVLPAGSPLLRAQLTSLNISSTHAWEDLDDMQGSLACMPHLDRLILHVGAIIPPKSRLPPPEAERPRVTLKSLRILDVRTSQLDDVGLLFDHIRISMDASIVIASQDSLGAPARSLKRFAISLQDLIDACQNRHIKYARAIISIPGPWFTYMGTQDTLDSAALGHASVSTRNHGDIIYRPGSLGLTVAQAEDSLASYSWFQSLLRLPSISSCTRLTIRDFEDHSPPSYWATLFANFTEVVELDLVRRASWSFVTSMAIATLFPMLRTLWISEVTITARDDDLPGLRTYQDSLRDAILKRVASGRLKKIRILRCDVTLDYVRELADEVGSDTIDWDRREWGWQDVNLSGGETSIDELDSSLDGTSEDS